MNYHKYNKYIYISLLIFLIFVISFILFGFYTKDKSAIKILNSKSNYQVTYVNNDIFNSLLDKWKIWDKNKLLVENSKKVIYSTLKGITIEFTDKNYTFLSQKDENGRILWSSSAEIIGKSDQIKISINIDPVVNAYPDYKNNKDKQTDKLITYIILSTLSLKISPPGEINKNVTSDINNIVESTEGIPFNFKASR